MTSNRSVSEIVERVARAMKTWTFAKSPCLDGYRICGVVVEGDRTSFPSKTFNTIAEAQAALDDLNARAAIAAIPPAGGVEERLREALLRTRNTLLLVGRDSPARTEALAEADALLED